MSPTHSRIVPHAQIQILAAGAQHPGQHRAGAAVLAGIGVGVAERDGIVGDHGRIGVASRRHPGQALLDQRHGPNGIAGKRSQPRRVGVERLTLGRIGPAAALDRLLVQVQRLCLVSSLRGNRAKALERPPRQLVVARGGRLVERLGQHAVGLIEATESDQERRVCEQGLMHALPE